MILKKLIIVTLVALTALTAGAADLARARRDADATQAMVMSPGAVCNRDGETFAEFLVKFTTDVAFNAERTRVASIFAIKPIADYRALVVTEGHDAGYVQQWTAIEPGCVSLECGFTGAPADYRYLFRQSDGKWFLDDRVTD